MKTTHHLGSLKDPRSEEEKEKDYKFHNLYSVAPVAWTAKAPATWKKATQRNQASSSSCVAHSSCEMIEVVMGKLASARPIYSKRSNAPGPGMYPQNAMDILKNIGTDTELNVPSDGLGETAMNVMVMTPTPLKIGTYGAINVDMEHLASAIDTHGAIIVSLNLSWKEWSVTEGVPTLIPGAGIDGGHEISVVDYTMWNGKKALVCKNHWVINGASDGYSIQVGDQFYVILTEDYVLARVDSAFFITPPVAPVPPTPPVPVVRATIKKGATGDLVKTLQTFLNKNGASIPTDPLNFGTFGPKTQSALIAFQTLHGLTPDGICGKMTWQAFDMIDIITAVCTAQGVEPLLGVSVASAESTLNPLATLFNPPSKSTDRGLFQWNSVYHSEISDASAFDPTQATILFCQAVKAGHLVGYWSASEPVWKKHLTPAILTKYGVK